MTVQPPVLASATAIAIVVSSIGWSSDARSDDTELWIRYQHSQRLTDSKRFFGSLRYRDTDPGNDSSASIRKADLRGGITIDAREWLRVELGGGAYYTEDNLAEDVREYRAWQAATFDWPESRGRRRYVFHHRFMFEQRFKSTNDWGVALRGRYRLSFALPLNRYTLEQHALYIPLSLEAFGDLGGGREDLFAESERFTAGIGYVISPQWTIELRYTRERRRELAEARFDGNGDIVEVRFKSALRILDLLKAR